MSETQTIIEPGVKENPIQQSLNESLHWATDSIPEAVESHAVLAHIAARDRLSLDYARILDRQNTSITPPEIIESKFVSISDYFEKLNVKLTDQEMQVIETGGFRIKHGQPISEDLMDLSSDVNKSIYPINRTRARIVMDISFIFQDLKTHVSPVREEEIHGYYGMLFGNLESMTKITRELQHIALLVKKAEQMHVEINPILENLEAIRKILMNQWDIITESRKPFLDAGVRVPVDQKQAWQAEMDYRTWKPEYIELYTNFSPRLWPDKSPKTPNEMNAELFRTRAEEVFKKKFDKLKKQFPEKTYPSLKFLLNASTLSDELNDKIVRGIAERLEEDPDEWVANAHKLHDSIKKPPYTELELSLIATVEPDQLSQDTYLDAVFIKKIESAIEDLEPEIQNLAKIYGGIWTREEEFMRSNIDEKVEIAKYTGIFPVADVSGSVYFHSLGGASKSSTLTK